MFDPGSMLILFALALMMVSPIHVAVTRLRISVAQVTPTLPGSVPLSAPSPNLNKLIRITDDGRRSICKAATVVSKCHDEPPAQS